MIIAKLQKLVDTLSHRALGSKAKSYTVRKLSTSGRRTVQVALKQTRHLRHFAFFGMIFVMAFIYLISVLHDRLKAASERPFNFVNNNFDAACRGWKRRRKIEEPVLRRRFWPIYKLAMESRDICPPYANEDEFVRLAEAALDDDIPMLEGLNCNGVPSRIAFRQALKLFASPPFCLHKNSINDLRFSWYREIRDRHIGGKRILYDLTQSSSFENYLLVGFRRELLKLIARGIKAAKSDVRIEDILGTADERFVDPDSALERDRIRAYVARKLTVKRRPYIDRVFMALEDGLKNSLEEVLNADPVYVTGEAFRQDERGVIITKPIAMDLLTDLQELVEHYGPERRPHHVDLERIQSQVEDYRELTRILLEFLEKEDPDRQICRDPGDARAIRMALQLDARLRKALLKPNKKTRALLIQAFSLVSENERDYDRALLELRSVFQGCLADFELYNRFLRENFFNLAYEHPDADFDPRFLKYLPRPFVHIKRGIRTLRHKLQWR